MSLPRPIGGWFGRWLGHIALGFAVLALGFAFVEWLGLHGYFGGEWRSAGGTASETSQSAETPSLGFAAIAALSCSGDATALGLLAFLAAAKANRTYALVSAFIGLSCLFWILSTIG